MNLFKQTARQRFLHLLLQSSQSHICFSPHLGNVLRYCRSDSMPDFGGRLIGRLDIGLWFQHILIKFNLIVILIVISLLGFPCRTLQFLRYCVAAVPSVLPFYPPSFTQLSMFISAVRVLCFDIGTKLYSVYKLSTLFRNLYHLYILLYKFLIFYSVYKYLVYHVTIVDRLVCIRFLQLIFYFQRNWYYLNNNYFTIYFQFTLAPSQLPLASFTVDVSVF